MPLDVTVSPKSVTATLHYLVRGAEKPVRYAYDAPEGAPDYNGIDDPREVRIEDARGRESEFTLDRNGFALVRASTQMQDFYNPEEVKSVYYPEVERLLKEQLGASRVFVFDHGVRNAGLPGGRTPSRQVHNDHTVNSAPRRVRDHLGADAEELLKRRFGVVNVWRPIRGPVLDSPLALCDARSFTNDDLIASDLVYKHVRGETSRVEYKPDHRWYYFSEQQRDEVLLIRGMTAKMTAGRACRSILRSRISWRRARRRGRALKLGHWYFSKRQAGAAAPDRAAAFACQEIVLNRSPTNGRETKPPGPAGRSPPTVVR
jgi:hypothetical protein